METAIRENPTQKNDSAKKPLLQQIREILRRGHYSLRTEQTYMDWIVRYIRFHGTVHPSQLGNKDVVEYLTHLAVKRNVTEYIAAEGSL